MSALTTPRIIPIAAYHFDQWTRLFSNYIAFYKSSLPDPQYHKTSNRLIDPQKDLYGLVVVDGSSAEVEGKLLGFAHYYPHQTPWNLFIDPAVRGGGLGRKLILAVAEDATTRGCFRLEWYMQHGNPARKLYDELATCDFVEYRIKLGES